MFSIRKCHSEILHPFSSLHSSFRIVRYSRLKILCSVFFVVKQPAVQQHYMRIAPRHQTFHHLPPSWTPTTKPSPSSPAKSPHFIRITHPSESTMAAQTVLDKQVTLLLQLSTPLLSITSSLLSPPQVARPRLQQSSPMSPWLL